MKRLVRLTAGFLTMLMIAALFCPEVRAEMTDPESVVVYDAADFQNMRNRSLDEVIGRYAQAQAAGDSYSSATSGTYYEEAVATTAPYKAGKVSTDTLKSMGAMTNYFRWLMGENAITFNTTSDTSLQAQALDRNFEFNHEISASSKPLDMDQATWDAGFTARHNVLACDYSPTGAITGWINEGYSTADSRFNSTGHRRALLDAFYSNISYGYSGRIAIGRCGEKNNTFDNAFAAFPAPGYMPAELISRTLSAWSVQLNTSKVTIRDESAVSIRVENLTSGDQYICTKANGLVRISEAFIDFRQPLDVTYGYYEDPYQVTVSGLVDTVSGREAAITYTVQFVNLTTKMISNATVTLTGSKYEYSGNAIRPGYKVRQNGKLLTEGTDYEASYVNNVNPGYAIVRIEGKGNYAGVNKKAFLIYPEECEYEVLSVINANGTSNMATITRKCKNCGATETKSISTLTSFTPFFRTTQTAGTSYYIDVDLNPAVGTKISYQFALMKPSSAEDKNVLVTSSDPSVLFVDPVNRQMTALKDGKAIITMAAEYNPSVKVSYTFIVGDYKDDPGTDNPGIDNPGIDNPGTDDPGTDDPGTDNPGTDNPGTDNPGTDKPGTDKPGTEKPDPIIPDISIPETIINILPGTEVFAKLQAKAVEETSSSITISWAKVSGAKNYYIFAAKKGQLPRRIAKLSSAITRFKNTGLAKGAYYRFLVVAANGAKLLSTSKSVYACTTGGKYTNVKSLTPSKTKFTLKRGKTYKLKVKTIKDVLKKTLLTCRKVSFQSGNKKIATVTSTGTVKGVKKGSCYIYVYAQNGVYRKVKVTVK